jgi:hypothetical protein
MKKIIFIILFATISISVIISCNKVGNIPISETPISAKPYRQIDTNGAGKPCGCHACFGICDITISGGPSGMIVYVHSSGTHGRFYILNDLDNFESDFIIDENISVPTGALSGSAFSSVNVLAGEYEFTEYTETVYFGTQSYTSYGYVDVDLDVEVL